MVSKRKGIVEREKAMERKKRCYLTTKKYYSNVKCCIIYRSKINEIS